MADKTTEARSRRAAGRNQRRSRVTEPFEELDQAAQEQSDGSGQSGDLAGTAAKVVGSALAAALLGAAAAAAKGLLERRRSDDGEEAQEREAEDNEASAEAPQAEQEDEQEDEHEDEQDDEASHDAAEDDSPQAAEPRGVDGEEPEEQEPAEGVSGDEAGKVVTEARRQLESLVGIGPERVSGLARSNDGWSVMLEVVEVARVPESTDVLATYELKLDDDLNVVSVNRQRRYRRSQVEEVS
jgi:Gas vesicle synthesis protein GvpO